MRVVRVVWLPHAHHRLVCRRGNACRQAAVNSWGWGAGHATAALSTDPQAEQTAACTAKRSGTGSNSNHRPHQPTAQPSPLASAAMSGWRSSNDTPTALNCCAGTMLSSQRRLASTAGSAGAAPAPLCGDGGWCAAASAGWGLELPGWRMPARQAAAAVVSHCGVLSCTLAMHNSCRRTSVARAPIGPAAGCRRRRQRPPARGQSEGLGRCHHHRPQRTGQHGGLCGVWEASGATSGLFAVRRAPAVLAAVGAAIRLSAVTVSARRGRFGAGPAACGAQSTARVQRALACEL